MGNCKKNPGLNPAVVHIGRHQSLHYHLSFIMLSTYQSVIISFLVLPQAPIKANTTVVNATYVVISWHRSPDDNGTLRYAVDCFKCKSNKDKRCYEACDRQVRYSPKKENITGINVTVNGLSPSSFYLFRVYSVNKLNQQETDKDKWKFATVFVETKGELKNDRIVLVLFSSLDQYRKAYKSPNIYDVMFKSQRA